MAGIKCRVSVGGNVLDEIPEFDGVIPVEVQDEMLEAEADIVQPRIEGNARVMLNGSYSTGETADSMTRKEPVDNDDGGRRLSLTWGGDRSDVKYGKRRRAEVAFINEYGGRGVAPRQFISKALNETQDASIEAAAEVFGRWQDGERK